jgi:hypothetical protein
LWRRVPVNMFASDWIFHEELSSGEYEWYRTGGSTLVMLVGVERDGARVKKKCREKEKRKHPTHTADQISTFGAVT